MLHVGLRMEHAVGGIAHPLASKRAELHIFAGLIIYVQAQLSSGLCQHSCVNPGTHSFECFG